MSSNWPLFREITGNMTAAAAATALTFSLGSSRQPLELVSVVVDMVTGSAANFTPTIGSKDGYTAGTINERWSASGATTTNNRSDSHAINRPFNTDENGNIYFKPNPNTGSNNEFNYMIVVRPL
jgi:hypothetical protein